MSTSQVLKGTLAMEWDRTALTQPRGAQVSFAQIAGMG
jgi:hypothetical protein